MSAHITILIVVERTLVCWQLDGDSLQSPTNLFAVRRKLSELLINKYNFRTTWIFDRTGTWHPLGISNGTDSNSTNIVAVKHVWRQTPIAVLTRIQSFSSHLRQQNRDILAYLTAKLLLSRLKCDQNATSIRWLSSVRHTSDCVSGRIDLRSHERIDSHRARFSWNFSISSTCALTTFPIRSR